MSPRSDHEPSILDPLFEALSHFEGEAPNLSALLALLAKDARIRDGGVDATPGAWLDALAAAAVKRALAAEGAFFVVVRSCAVQRDRDTLVTAVVEHRRTVLGVRVAGTVIAASAVVRGAGADASIERLEIVREPASGARLRASRNALLSERAR